MKIPLISFRAKCVNAAVSKRRDSNSFMSDSIKEDTFERTTQDVVPESIKSFKFKRIPIESNSDDSFLESLKLREAVHKKRLERFQDNTPKEPLRRVGREEYRAICDVQFEREEYSDVKRKIKYGEPLNKKEQQFYDRILASMTPTDKS